MFVRSVLGESTLLRWFGACRPRLLRAVAGPQGRLPAGRPDPVRSTCWPPRHRTVARWQPQPCWAPGRLGAAANRQWWRSNPRSVVAGGEDLKHLPWWARSLPGLFDGGAVDPPADVNQNATRVLVKVYQRLPSGQQTAPWNRHRVHRVGPGAAATPGSARGSSKYWWRIVSTACRCVFHASESQRAVAVSWKDRRSGPRGFNHRSSDAASSRVAWGDSRWQVLRRQSVSPSPMVRSRCW